MKLRSGLALVVVIGGATCAQPPTAEVSLARARVDAAQKAEAALFAPALLAEAEAALSLAESQLRSGSAYRAALAAAAKASLRAEEAKTEAKRAKSKVSREAERLRRELDSLLAIARARGADAPATLGELEALTARARALGPLFERGEVLTALSEAEALKPALLAFERRFR